MAAKKKASTKTKPKTPQGGLHRQVHDIWGWVVLALGMLMIFSVAGYYYLSLMQ